MQLSLYLSNNAVRWWFVFFFLLFSGRKQWMFGVYFTMFQIRFRFDILHKIRVRDLRERLGLRRKGKRDLSLLMDNATTAPLQEFVKMFLQFTSLQFKTLTATHTKQWFDILFQFHESMLKMNLSCKKGFWIFKNQICCTQGLV